MIYLTPEQLYKKIQADEIKYITYYEGFVANPKEQRQMFHRFKNENSEAVLADAQNLLNEFTGLFTVMMYKTQTGTSEPPLVYRVQSKAGGVLNGTPQPGQLTQEEMFTQVLEKFRKELEDKAKEAEIADLKSQLQGFKTGGDRLAYVMGQILEKTLLKNHPKLAGAMNGNFDESTDVTDQKPKTENMDKETEEKKEYKDPKLLSESIALIVKFYGEDAINKFAKTIKEDPAKAEGLKLFL